MSSWRRRFPLALAASLGLHVALGAAVVASSLWNAWRTPIDVEIAGMSLEELKDLPLGASAAGERREEAVVAPPPPAAPPRRAPAASQGEEEAKARERRARQRAAEEDPNGGRRRPGRPACGRTHRRVRG